MLICFGQPRLEHMAFWISIQKGQDLGFIPKVVTASRVLHSRWWQPRGAQRHAGESPVVATPGRPQPVIRCALEPLALVRFPSMALQTPHCLHELTSILSTSPFTALINQPFLMCYVFNKGKNKWKRMAFTSGSEYISVLSTNVRFVSANALWGEDGALCLGPPFPRGAAWLGREHRCPLRKRLPCLL